MSIKGKFVKSITVFDEDSRAEVQVYIYKLETGGMIGIDESFLANTDEPVYSPYDVGTELDLD